MNANKLRNLDDARRQRLMDLNDLFSGNSTEKLSIRFPSTSEQLKREFSMSVDGPSTILKNDFITMERALSRYSKIVRSGATVQSHDKIEDLVTPVVDLSKKANWGTSNDLDNTPLIVGKGEPNRISSFITVSDMLKHQNPLIAGLFIEQQLLSSIGSAIDDASIQGTGTGQPLGILNDGDVLTHTRATLNVDALADLTNMEKLISDNYGEDRTSNYVFILDSVSRKNLQESGLYVPSQNLGQFTINGHRAITIPNLPANTTILTQIDNICVWDFNSLKIENVFDKNQAIQGFRTMLVSGFFDCAILNPKSVCVSVNP